MMGRLTEVQGMKTRRQEDEEQEATEILAHRQELAQELARLRAEQLAALLPLAKAEERAKVKLERAHDALQAAHDAYMGAMGAHAGCSNLYSRKLGKVERELTSTAPVAIASFVAEMRALAEQVGTTPTKPYRDDGRCSLEERKALLQAAQDAVTARENRVKRILAAIPQAEALKLQALDAATLDSRLDALRATTDAAYSAPEASARRSVTEEVQP